MMKKFLAFFGVILTVWMGTLVLSPVNTFAAAGECSEGFLGFRPWYDGLCEDGEIKQPQGEDELISNVWTIALNILVDLLVAVGYLSLGFVVYGGYLYIMSQGDPGKLAKGKKTLTSAIIGTIIAMVASVAVNTLKVVLGITSNGWNQGEITQAQVTNLFSWVYTVAGIVAVIFIVKGALEYMISHGDPGKTRAATQTILYSVVGLIIVLLAAVITRFVVSSISGTL